MALAVNNSEGGFFPEPLIDCHYQLKQVGTGSQSS